MTMVLAYSTTQHYIALQVNSHHFLAGKISLHELHAAAGFFVSDTQCIFFTTLCLITNFRHSGVLKYNFHIVLCSLKRFLCSVCELCFYGALNVHMFLRSTVWLSWMLLHFSQSSATKIATTEMAAFLTKQKTKYYWYISTQILKMTLLEKQNIWISVFAII